MFMKLKNAGTKLYHVYEIKERIAYVGKYHIDV